MANTTTTKVRKHHRKAAKRIVASAKSKLSKKAQDGLSDEDMAMLAGLLGAGLADGPESEGDLGFADSLQPVEGEDEDAGDDGEPS